ncbi:MAG: DEAD/DEAH box helicase [Psychroflexus sp.]|nr:DEAD/DEAH box helicase [Psychroflexus sp.]
MSKFNELGLNDKLSQTAQKIGFEQPTEVQSKVIPTLLEHESTDLIALAQTGTGKTAAFGFPLLQKIDSSKKHTQGLILAPTRELCLQITKEMQAYSQLTEVNNIVAIYGGASIDQQAKSVRKGAQIVVATPGRMKDMINRNLVNINQLEYCILDEADEMLNMGFYEDITSILSHTPAEKDTWLFSATMPKEVSRIAGKFMRQPVEITVGAKNEGTKNVSHEYFIINRNDRFQALKRLVDANPNVVAIIFCRTKRDTQKVADQLVENGYSANAIHGDLSQQQRDLVMNSFRKKQIKLLVATDVAARGIDVDDISRVINYQLPDEIEVYTHRSGRTGRAGKSGKSLIIITKSELRKLKQLQKIIGQKFEEQQLPSVDFIIQQQLLKLVNQIKNSKVDSKIEDYMPEILETFENDDKDSLIKKFLSVEFNRFNQYYQKEGQLKKPEKDTGKKSFGNEVRFFINLGEKDGFNWMKLKDFLKDTLQEPDNIQKVDVMGTFSFFNTPADLENKVLEHLNGQDYKGRSIQVEVSKDKPGKSGKKRKKVKREDNIKSSFKRRRKKR